MAMRLKNVEEILEDGVVYIVETYSNGEKETVVKTQKSDENAEVEEPEPTPDPVMEKLESIEAKIQENEDLQTFYDDIVKEVGL